ncbi:HlyC/CorC family transporter [Candidatus Hydrogenosomobacter endosymbioticus]|uniref:Membrane protein n=1 Tax=Candidatus Hydrogenosomobacter endosymbioticus TaxID=2558174 RepID=A0ABN6L239_9PROT|nr:CNNM domain-containing protein [Candidatus Hydrogenosomobacter endosymbioticus]BDB95891.1 membrane protein [Candidatus Hydrogenosomobacter endosymbioticus]
MSLVISIIVSIIAVMCAAVLSASETAVTASSRLRLYQLAKKGHKRAMLLLSLQDNMSTLISSVLLANTWLIAGVTALATHVLVELTGEIGVVIASFFIALFITVYVEVLPKIYVYRNPEKVGIALASWLELLRNFLFPVTVVIDKIARFSLSTFGISIKSQPLKSNLDELRGAIDLHVGDGAVVHERAMLNSILDLSHVSVEEIMIHRKNIVSFDIETPTEKLCNKILKSTYTRIPLWKGSPDNIVGVVNVKDLARALQNSKPADIDFASLASSPWFIPESTVLFAQLQLFREKHKHQAFVVDEYGALLGMISLEDILEEIVGEILDEHDIKISGVRVTSKGHYIVSGEVTLRDLKRQYNWDLECENAATIAGLILQKTREIPETGSIVKINGFEIKILRKQQNQIVLVKILPKNENPAIKLPAE